MKFLVERIDFFENDKEKPCKEAFKNFHEKWDIRTCSEDEFNKERSSIEGLWKSKGKNHSITQEGYIKRQLNNQEAWFIELNSIEDLFNFVKKNGQINIFFKKNYNCMVIKIKN